ncbi:hypothetical protein [Sinorhizobium phage phiM5]|nr:hypothetical protein [Sinorhizobium phage phiM5]
MEKRGNAAPALCRLAHGCQLTCRQWHCAECLARWPYWIGQNARCRAMRKGAWHNVLLQWRAFHVA